MLVLGILLVGRISGQMHDFRECSSSSCTSSSGTDYIEKRHWLPSILKYTVIVLGYRDGMNICMYLHSSSCPPVAAIKWCRLSVIAPLKSLDIENTVETPSIGSIERVLLVADILPYYFRSANTAVLTEEPLQLYSTQHNCIPHSTEQRNTRSSL